MPSHDRASGLLDQASGTAGDVGKMADCAYLTGTKPNHGSNEQTMATDTLSDVLKTVRLTGATYFDIAAQEPWSVHSPARDVILPRILPGADRLIAYHVVTSGRCYASLNGGEAVLVE